MLGYISSIKILLHGISFFRSLSDIAVIKGKLTEVKSEPASTFDGSMSNHLITHFNSLKINQAAAISHIFGVASNAPNVCPIATLVIFRLDTPSKRIFPGNTSEVLFCNTLIERLHSETHSLFENNFRDDSIGFSLIQTPYSVNMPQ